MKRRVKSMALLTVFVMIILSVFTSTGITAATGDKEGLTETVDSQPILKFGDVSQEHWAYKFITSMVERKILSGYPDGVFKPDKLITRAEFAKIILGAAGVTPKKSEKTSFEDVKIEDWFCQFVEGAKEYLTGYRLTNGGYMYYPDQPALREDIAIAVVKMKGYEQREVDRTAAKNMFNDWDSVSEVAKDYVALAVQNKLMSGFPDGTFRGQEGLTRAQASSILYNAFLLGNDNKELLGYMASITPLPNDSETSTPTPAITSTIKAKKLIENIIDNYGEEISTDYCDIEVDNNGYVYCKKIGSNNIQKININSGKIKTIPISGINALEEFKVYKNPSTNIVEDIDTNRFSAISLLAHDKANNKVYVCCQYSGSLLIYEINPTFKSIIKISQLDRNGLKFFNVFDGKFTIGTGDMVYIYDSWFNASSSYKQSSVCSIIEDDYYIYGLEFKSYYDNEKKDWHIDKLQMSGLTNRFADGDMGEKPKFAIAHNGKFYALGESSTIYEISTNGSITKLVDIPELNAISNNRIKIVGFCFDNMDNIIFCQAYSGAIGRINRYDGEISYPSITPSPSPTPSLSNKSSGGNATITISANYDSHIEPAIKIDILKTGAQGNKAHVFIDGDWGFSISTPDGNNRIYNVMFYETCKSLCDQINYDLGSEVKAYALIPDADPRTFYDSNPMYKYFKGGVDGDDIINNIPTSQPSPTPTAMTTPTATLTPTPTVMTTPTATLTPTAIVASTPMPTPYPLTPSGAKLYSVDTLAGGIGQGDVDGPVSRAKLFTCNDMVIDKDDNAYILDRVNRKIRKLSINNGTVETFKLVDDKFNCYRKEIGNIAVSTLQLNKLAYNTVTNKVYLLTSGGWTNGFGKELIYDITEEVQLSAYADLDRARYDGIADDTGFVVFGENDSVTLSKHYGGHAEIFQGVVGGKLELIASDADKTGPTFTMASMANIENNIIYCADMDTIKKITLFPRKLEQIELSRRSVLAFGTSHNGKFYKGFQLPINEVDMNGNVSAFVDEKNVTLNDGNTFSIMYNLNFDAKGNLIFYDPSNFAIRRINLQ